MHVITVSARVDSFTDARRSPAITDHRRCVAYCIVSDMSINICDSFQMGEELRKAALLVVISVLPGTILFVGICLYAK